MVTTKPPPPQHKIIYQKNQPNVGKYTIPKDSDSYGILLLMAEILHQLRLVVYPIIYRVSAPSKRWLGMGFQPSTVVMPSQVATGGVWYGCLRTAQGTEIFQTAPEKSKRVFFGGWDTSLGTKRSFYSYFLVVGCSILLKNVSRAFLIVLFLGVSNNMAVNLMIQLDGFLVVKLRRLFLIEKRGTSDW